MSNSWFYKIYAIFGGALLLISGAIIAVSIADFYVKWTIPALLICVFLLAGFFVITLKKGVLSIFRICSHFLDDAIAGKPLQPLKEETELAALEEKIVRFTHMREKGFRDNKREKERIETLLSDISHQTKTPITNILIYSQLLEERTRADKKIHSQAVKLTAQSEKLKGLIQELVELSRLENGIISCSSKMENMRDFLLQVVGDFYDKAQSKEILLHLDCHSSVEGFFDSKWMREAVGNIVDNAIKYSPQRTGIQIRVLPYELYIRVDIQDQGMGISREDLNKVFQRFYRSRKTSSTEGLGLGLYIAREMITAQNGYIKVSSEEDTGSIFSVFMPAENRM